MDKRIDKLSIIVFYDYEKIFVKKELYERNSTPFFPFFFRYFNPFSLKVTCLESITKLVKNVRS